MTIRMRMMTLSVTAIITEFDTPADDDDDDSFSADAVVYSTYKVNTTQHTS